MNDNKWIKNFLIVASYFLVAAVAVSVTLWVTMPEKASKLDTLQELLSEKYIGEADPTAMEDAAANAMVEAMGDRWSYYISAESYAAHMERKKNAYVGIGITITVREDGVGFDVTKVEPGGPAQEAGVLPGDILTHAEGQPVAEMGTDGAANVIKGEEGTMVNVTFLRGDQVMELTMERRTIQQVVAEWQMLPGNIGYIEINNFNTNCADQTIQAVEELVEEGAKALIFDVRNNPGGYVDELVEVLDYLLPEGVVFRSENYLGQVSIEKSDADCLKLPMAVMYNGNSYSAAEFFAATLEEYDWAITVGEPTSGKSRYQITYQLGDGSAVNVSTGRYTTPNHVDLAEQGGLIPKVLVEIDEETAALIYADALDFADDPQLQAAIHALTEQ